MTVHMLACRGHVLYIKVVCHNRSAARQMFHVIPYYPARVFADGNNLWLLLQLRGKVALVQLQQQRVRNMSIKRGLQSVLGEHSNVWRYSGFVLQHHYRVSSIANILPQSSAETTQPNATNRRLFHVLYHLMHMHR